MIDVRIVGCFLLISAWIGFNIAKFNVPPELRIVLACSAGAFIGLCLAYIDEQRKPKDKIKEEVKQSNRGDIL